MRIQLLVEQVLKADDQSGLTDPVGIAPERVIEEFSHIMLALSPKGLLVHLSVGSLVHVAGSSAVVRQVERSLKQLGVSVP